MRHLIFILLILLTFSTTSCGRPVVTVTKTGNTTVVTKLPRKYKVVRVNGKRYYFFNGRHYKRIKRGYVVVKV